MDRLEEDLVSLTARLASFPELGRELMRERERSLRRIAVGRLPFFVWYESDPRGTGTVRMWRLFQAHQRTPRPELP